MDTPQPNYTPTPAPYIPPQVQAPTPPPSGSHTGVLVGILIAVLVIAAAAYYFFIRTPGEVVVSPSPGAPDASTANWKTYTNTEYGFEFKYPTSLSTKISQAGEIVTIEIVGTPLDGKIIVNNPGRGGYDLENRRVGSVQTESGLHISYGTGRVIEYPSGKVGEKVIWYGGIGADSWIFFEFFSNNGSDQTALVESILSTFKFTADPTASWKTYTNEQLGVSVMYPPAWTSKEQVSGSSVFQAQFSGPEGIFTIVTGDFGGGPCPTAIVQMKTASGSYGFCKTMKADGSGSFGIGNESPALRNNGRTYQLQGNVNNPYLINEPVFVSILSTFKLTK